MVDLKPANKYADFEGNWINDRSKDENEISRKPSDSLLVGEKIFQLF